MYRIEVYLSVFIFILGLTIIPVYAEVTSLKTNSPLYKSGSIIHFSGTILDTDNPNVTIIVFDPTNKFLMLTSGIADNNHQFQAMIDTSTQSGNQNKFLLKGVYNATAFVTNKSNGKTVSFVVSPDGSPIIPSSPTSLTASTISSTEIDLSWTIPVDNSGLVISGYKIERNDGNGFTVIQNVQSKSYYDTGLTPSKQYSYRVSSINSAGTSSTPTNVATATTLPPSTPSNPTPSPQTNSVSSPSLDELIKQRLETAKKLQALIHGAPSNSSTTTPSTTTPSTTTPSDNSKPKSNNASENNQIFSTTSFDIKTILYPLISLFGVGIVITVLYLRKKKKVSPRINESHEIHFPKEQPFEKKDEDYAMMILKNRLAKGEITIEEFKILKDELSEP
jgi:hypothetical protein